MANLLSYIGETQLPINVSGAHRAFRKPRQLLSRQFDFAPRGFSITLVAFFFFK
jgi:hypothetical protein